MKKLLDLLTAAAVSTVMMFAAACNPEKLPDDRFPDDEDRLHGRSYPEGYDSFP